MACSPVGSLSDVESLDEKATDEETAKVVSNLSCGDGPQLHKQTGGSWQFQDDEFMDPAELVRCLNEIDNELPSGPGWQPVQDNPQLLRPPHCRRDAVAKIVPLRTPSTFCYAVVSRLGRVGVYDASFALLDSYTLELGFVHPHAKIGTGRDGDLREPRQCNTWVNDAVFLSDAQMLVIAASDRSLTMLDASRLLHSRRCQVRSLPAAPRCLAYAAGDVPGAPSRLFVGDDAGTITTLTFQRPRWALLRPPDAENKSTSFFWPELRQQGEWVTIQQDPKVHGDAVSRLWYESHNDTLLSCSRDPRRTLVIRHLAGRREPYTFSLPRGASCFVLDRSLQLLVTAGCDALVRLWNPLVPSQPLAVLQGHKAPVLDVAVIPQGQLVVSFDLRGVLRVWHAAEQACLQTVPLPFSCLTVPGRRIEHGARSLYPGPPAGSGPPDSDGAEVLVAALCGELVTIRLLPYRGATRDVHEDGGPVLGPPRREQSPAIPESWSPASLSAASSLRAGEPLELERQQQQRQQQQQQQQQRQQTDPDPAVPLSDPGEEEAVPAEFPDSGELSEAPSRSELAALPRTPSPLPESIEDWPVPDDRLFKEDEPQMRNPKAAAPATGPGPGSPPPQPVSHRPVPDQNGLYPEEIASLRALGLRPLDLESIGVSLSSTGPGGALALLPMDALAGVRQARNAHKKSHKQMRTLAWHCAPHLALKLPEETPIKFSRPLPVTSRMRARGMDVSEPARLLQAKLHRLVEGRPKAGTAGTAGTRTGSATSSARLSGTGDSGTGSIIT